MDDVAMSGGEAGTDCPACGSLGVRDFLHIADVPANSCVSLETRADAVAYPRGDIALACCEHCGYLFNRAFDPGLTEYSGRYEETQGFSPTFRRFHRELAETLVGRFDLGRRKVLEVGCGKGEFLALLAEVGGVQGTGFDPAFDPGRAPAGLPGVRFVRDFYSPRHADVDADFVCCKMTLEHIARPRELLATLRRNLDGRPESDLFFMVPDATRILREGAVEDIYYEHCAYYTPVSLARLFTSSGFRVLGLETLYDGQYLAIHARPAAPEADRNVEGDNVGGDAVAAVVAAVAGFTDRFRERRGYWRRFVADCGAAGSRIAVWGGGSKAVALLSLLGEAAAVIDCVVDINPHRQGAFLPGSGLRIEGPAALAARDPDVVLVMNRVYLGEIKADLAALGLAPGVVAF